MVAGAATTAVALAVVGGVIGRSTAPTGSAGGAAGGAGGSSGTHSTRWGRPFSPSTGAGGWSPPSAQYGSSGPDGAHGWGSARPGGDGTGSSGSIGTTDTSRASADQLTGMVRIVATSAYRDGTAAGTGMVLTSDGEVVTNNHVVEGATRIRATVMSTGRTYVARLLGTDAGDDVAVLQLSGATGLDPVTTASDSTTTGAQVTAVGDANGATGYLTAATGTVTAIGRSITTRAEDGTAGERLHGLIEIDADVVPGDSGGAVLDEDGRVVGMTTAASSGSSEVTGYAIPVGTVLDVVDVVDSGEDTDGVQIGYDAFLGVELEAGSGTRIAGVLEGTPAEHAGLVGGDRITRVDGTPVSTPAQLRKAVAAHEPGDRVRLAWTDTTGASHSATLRLARGPVA